MFDQDRAGLRCQKERGLKKQRERKRSRASEEGEKLGPLSGRAGTGGAAEGNGRYWRGCGGCGGRSALVHSVYSDAGEHLDVRTRV